jgi:uncharacterized protein YecT (DUF1311 family)
VDKTAGAGGQDEELILRAQFAIVTAAALIGAAAFAFAGEQGDPDKGCDGGTPEIVDCLNAQRAHWDKELAIAYQEALKNVVPAQRESLRMAERAWIKYRDANCAFYERGEGSIARNDATECLRSMTESRARELEKLK